MHSIAYRRKQSKRSHAKSKTFTRLADHDDGNSSCKIEAKQTSDRKHLHHNREDGTVIDISNMDNFFPRYWEASNSEKVESSTLEIPGLKSSTASKPNISLREMPKEKSGGIFKYLRCPIVGDVEDLLSAASGCYEEARNALGGLPSGSEELQSVTKRIGWVCNELGRYRLEAKELTKAEISFADAIKAFREVADHTNIILINCNLGHGRRALAEAMVSKIDDLKVHGVFHSAYDHAVQTAKFEYSESLKYYGAAKSELNTMAEESGAVSSSLRTEVYTQFAHTYLRLGMLLAREDATAEIYGSAVVEDEDMCYGSPSGRRTRKELQKHEISANDAIREALSMYESLGDLRKQEAAYAYFQLACYHRDCCLKFLGSGYKKSNLSKGESNNIQRAKQYASLAERSWQKAVDFYGPKTHPSMYMTIMMERSALSSSLSNPVHSNAMLESALSYMLEGCNVPETTFNLLKVDYPELHSKFWGQLQMLLKKMLAAVLSGCGNRTVSQSNPSSNISGNAGKLRELYGKSLKSSDYSQLNAMYTLWRS